MKLRFSQRANRDIAEIADHIRAQNPYAAERVRTAILDSLQTVILFPRTGRLQTLEGVRKLVVRRYPYLIYYTIDDLAEEVIVLAIQHASRDRDCQDS
jgi:toxin ParE1/3/4